MEREPTIKERIELFIQRLLDNGFVEQDEDEVQQYVMFFIGTPLDTRIFKIESLYELAKNHAQIECRCIEFR